MRLMQELYRLLQTWRRQDRIRSAPGVGKLLNLEPGRQLLIGQALYRVHERVESSGAESLAVTYYLSEIDSETTVQLTVAIDLARPSSGVLTLAQISSTVELFYQDVSVLA